VPKQVIHITNENYIYLHALYNAELNTLSVRRSHSWITYSICHRLLPYVTRSSHSWICNRLLLPFFPRQSSRADVVASNKLKTTTTYSKYDSITVHPNLHSMFLKNTKCMWCALLNIDDGMVYYLSPPLHGFLLAT